MDRKIWDVVGASAEYQLKHVIEEAQKVFESRQACSHFSGGCQFSFKAAKFASNYGVVSKRDKTVDKINELAKVANSRTDLDAAAVLP